MSEPQTEFNTGPTVPNPEQLGLVMVEVGESVTLSESVIDRLEVRGNAVVTNCRVLGTVIMDCRQGQPNKLHLINSAVHVGIYMAAHDAGGNIDYNTPVPVDVRFDGSWIRHPQGDGSFHTEALACFGRPVGARFSNTTFIQEGPYNNSATAVINWHGYDTEFDACYFGWGGTAAAAYYSVYISGDNNSLMNSWIENGIATYLYPEADKGFAPISDTGAGNSVVNTADAFTNELIPQSTGTPPPPPDPEPDPMRTVFVDTLPANGTITNIVDAATGALAAGDMPIYQRNAGYVGADSFTYHFTDDARPGEVSDTATVTLDVKEALDAVDDSFQVVGDGPVPLDVLANDPAA